MASRIDPRLQHYPPSGHYSPASLSQSLQHHPPPASAYPYRSYQQTPSHPDPASHQTLHPATSLPHSRYPPQYHQELPQPYYTSQTGQRLPSPPQRPGSSDQSQHNDQDDSPLEGPYQDPNDPNDPKRARACESCRGLKVRCDRDPAVKDQPCARCAKAKRSCIVTEPSRKRQKKTDSRVAELERKIERLSALLPAHVQELESASQGDQNDDSVASEPQSPASSKHTKKPRTASPDRESAQTNGSNQEFTTSRQERQWSGSVVSTDKTFRPPHATIPEGCGLPEASEIEAPEPVSAFVSRRISDTIDETTATQIFDHYIADMAVHMPAIVFPPGTRATEVHKTKPILFLSILVASSVGIASPAIQMDLHALLLSALADCLIGNVEKRLDVVQALLVATIWYRAPRRYEQMNFYQLAHSAAVMGIDLGLGKKTKLLRPPTTAGRANRLANKQLCPVPDSLEARRTWLGCYFQCATISMCLRRPALVRWSKYLEESLELLETSNDALQSDKLLCQHVKLQRLNEEIGQRFSMDDPSAPINITDTQVQEALRGFEGALASWRKSAQTTIWNSMSPKATQSGKEVYSPRAAAALEISEKVTGLYMHEIALHIGHNVDDFRAPFTEEMLRSSASQGMVLSPAHSKALLDCLRAVHSIFDIFFSFDLAVVRSLPIFFFMRVGYAVVVLVRLHFAVMAPESEISKLISPEDVAVERYLGILLKIFETVHEQDSFRPATKFLVIVKRLSKWFQESRDNVGQETSGDKNGSSKAAGVKRQRNEGGSRRVAAAELRASTPLDVLSHVATANVSAGGMMGGGGGGGEARHMQVHTLPSGTNNASWYYNNMMGANNISTEGAGEFAMGMDFGQTIDMTLSGVMDETADLSWLFMNPDFNGFAGGAGWQAG